MRRAAAGVAAALVLAGCGGSSGPPRPAPPGRTPPAVGPVRVVLSDGAARAAGGPLRFLGRGTVRVVEPAVARRTVRLGASCRRGVATLPTGAALTFVGCPGGAAETASGAELELTGSSRWAPGTVAGDGSRVQPWRPRGTAPARVRTGADSLTPRGVAVRSAVAGVRVRFASTPGGPARERIPGGDAGELVLDLPARDGCGPGARAVQLAFDVRPPGGAWREAYLATDGAAGGAVPSRAAGPWLALGRDCG